MVKFAPHAPDVPTATRGTQARYVEESPGPHHTATHVSVMKKLKVRRVTCGQSVGGSDTRRCGKLTVLRST